MATAYRTTAPARSSCRCPLCSGSTIGADGVYHCRAGVKVEYLVFVAGEFQRAYATYLAAETELNKARRDALTAPVELAAAEADLDAQAAAHVAEQGACDCPRCSLAPRNTPDGVYFCATKQTVDAYHKGKLVATASDTAPVAAANLVHVKSVLDGYRAADAPASTEQAAAEQTPAEILPFTPDHSPLDPRPTPPAISYSAAWGGFSWVGAPIVDGHPATYPTYTAAATARDALLTQARIKAAYPKDARAVTVQLAERGLIRAAA